MLADSIKLTLTGLAVSQPAWARIWMEQRVSLFDTPIGSGRDDECASMWSVLPLDERQGRHPMQASNSCGCWCGCKMHAGCTHASLLLAALACMAGAFVGNQAQAAN